MPSLFGLTATDIQKKIQPLNGEWTFQIGTPGDLSAADCEAIIAIQEDRVLSALPDKHRKLMRRVDGEVLTRYATAGQATLKTGLTPVVVGSLALYVDFPEALAWADRNPSHALELAAFSLNSASGIITLVTPLKEGQRVAAEYEHGAASKNLWLRELVVTYSAVEIARRFAYFRTAEGVERFDAWEAQADRFLGEMRRSQRPGVEGIETLKLIDEIRPNSWAKFFGDG